MKRHAGVGALIVGCALLAGALVGCGRAEKAESQNVSYESAAAPASAAPAADAAAPASEPPASSVALAPAPESAPANAPPPAPSRVTDQRVIECARAGTWGLGECPTREQLVAHMSRPGSIAFTDPPTHMNLGDSYVIHVAAGVGGEMAAEAVREAAGPDVKVAEQRAPLLPSLEAELTGVGFDIRPLQSGARQTLLGDRPNEWSWEVRPREEGGRRLTLTVWGLLTFGDERFPRIRVQTLRHDVDVTVNWPTRLRLAGLFAAEHWEATGGIGAALLAFFAWVAARLRRRPKASI